MTVGRSVECDLRIDHASVSRKHVCVTVNVDVQVEDLGSSNGTRVRGQLLKPGERVPVQPNEVIEVGSAMVVVQAATEGRRELLTGDEAAMASSTIDALPQPPMEAVQRLIDLVAPSDLSVIINGETGVGKEVAAQALHSKSRRSSRPFLQINCAAVPEPLLESELFGYERGAFTGAVKAKPGLLETARGGTVLLDEIGEMPAPIQAKLLRTLESREVLRLGGLETRHVDIRILSATNRNLQTMVGEGKLRSDLYFRLNGITIRVPPLRERLDEIVPLAERFVHEAARATNSSGPPISREALRVLRAYRWPGNIRELRNVMQRAVVLCTGGQILPVHLQLDDVATVGPGNPAPAEAKPTSDRERLIEALSQCGGNQTRAAELLGISRRTLLNRLDAYGLPRPKKGKNQRR